MCLVHVIPNYSCSLWGCSFFFHFIFRMSEFFLLLLLEFFLLYVFFCSRLFAYYALGYWVCVCMLFFCGICFEFLFIFTFSKQRRWEKKNTQKNLLKVKRFSDSNSNKNELYLALCLLQILTHAEDVRKNATLLALFSSTSSVDSIWFLFFVCVFFFRFSLDESESQILFSTFVFYAKWHCISHTTVRFILSVVWWFEWWFCSNENGKYDMKIDSSFDHAFMFSYFFFLVFVEHKI